MRRTSRGGRAAAKPWVVAFWETMRLPSGEVGPVDLRELARLAASLAGERGLGLGVGARVAGWFCCARVVDDIEAPFFDLRMVILAVRVS